MVIEKESLRGQQGRDEGMAEVVEPRVGGVGGGGGREEGAGTR